MEVEPPSGFFGNTTFTLRAKGWIDDDLPLTYDFGYIVDGSEGTKEITLGTTFVNSYNNAILPQGIIFNHKRFCCFPVFSKLKFLYYITGKPSNNFSVIVFVRVYDIYGAWSVQYSSAVVKPTEQVHINMTYFAQSVQEDFASGDFNKGAGMWDTMTIS